MQIVRTQGRQVIEIEQLALPRIVEPRSTADTIRVPAEIGVTAPRSPTLSPGPGRCVDRHYRDQFARACMDRTAARESVAMVKHDVTVRQKALLVRMEARGHHNEPDGPSRPVACRSESAGRDRLPRLRSDRDGDT
ncbi:MAG: hypothetical protein ACYC1E_18005 [Propionibacteriaceae bacterium]